MAEIEVQNFLKETEFSGDNPSESETALGGTGEEIAFMEKKPIIPSSIYSSDDDVDHEKCSELQIQNTRIFVDTFERFCAYIHDSPDRLVHLDAAAEDLGVDKDSLYVIIRGLKASSAVVELMPDTIAWVARGPSPKVIEIQTSLKRLKALEKAITSQSDFDKKNGTKRRWRWLYLTASDIKDFVELENDVYMAVKCPSDVNLEVPRHAQDGGDVVQRRYAIICSELEGMKRYLVSKLESHDDVVKRENKRSKKVQKLFED